MNRSDDRIFSRESQVKGFSRRRYLAGGPEDCLKHVILLALLRHMVSASHLGIEEVRRFVLVTPWEGRIWT